MAGIRLRLEHRRRDRADLKPERVGGKAGGRAAAHLSWSQAGFGS